jgi:hypothetical protein
LKFGPAAVTRDITPIVHTQASKTAQNLNMDASAISPFSGFCTTARSVAKHGIEIKKVIIPLLSDT